MSMRIFCQDGIYIKIVIHQRLKILKKCNWVQVDNEMLWPDLNI